MKWLGWLKRSNRDEHPVALAWRQKWERAAGQPDPAAAEELRGDLSTLDRSGEDERFEIEREMLDGLDALVELASAAGSGEPPILTTGHRAVGSDRCYLIAPASLPDDPAQPSGTLLLTNTRAIFVGGARATTMAWHMVGDSVRQDRDVVLVRVDKQDMQRFRCNSYADALRALFLARRLATRRRV